MTYKQRGSKFKQISAHLIVYAIYVLLGSTALVFSHRLWNTTVGHLIIFMSPYIIFTAINYGYRFWRKSSASFVRGSKHRDTQECKGPT
jgi:hypothetical protein